MKLFFLQFVSTIFEEELERVVLESKPMMSFTKKCIIFLLMLLVFLVTMLTGLIAWALVNSASFASVRTLMENAEANADRK